MSLTFKMHFVRALTLSVLMAAAPAVAGENHADAAPAQVNEKLEPLSWLIGNWEGGASNFAGGEVRYFAMNTYRWILDGEAMLVEWVNRNREGNVSEVGYGVYFINPETRALSFRDFSSSWWANEGRVIEVGKDSTLWDVRMVRGSGEQGQYKQLLKKVDDSTFQMGWSKVSGTGGNNFQLTFRRLSEQDAKARQNDAELSIDERLNDLAWLVGEWKGSNSSSDREGSNEESTEWILNGKALLTNWLVMNDDGTVKDRGLSVYYIDPVQRRPAVWTVMKGKTYGNGTVVKLSDAGADWQCRAIWPGGGQAHYTKAMAKDGDNSFTVTWSRISGDGPDKMGPVRYERIGDAPAEQSGAPEDT